MLNIYTPRGRTQFSSYKEGQSLEEQTSFSKHKVTEVCTLVLGTQLELCCGCYLCCVPLASTGTQESPLGWVPQLGTGIQDAEIEKNPQKDNKTAE